MKFRLKRKTFFFFTKAALGKKIGLKAAQAPSVNPVKLFTAVIYDFSQKARVFVPGKPYQTSLMCVGKARGQLLEGRLWPYLQPLD